ncbi:hypothetical protein ABEB36_011038 [Hypothenemus hampei]|uniref:Nuclear respiratory factor 1 NLS/DNA-binding dimerisation domain-containing protein n=1 Tax=Hypothenemus hampei TaxID=57062 RepID=A0ABD1EE74_HYPHA
MFTFGNSLKLESVFESNTDLIAAPKEDEVTTQLPAAGPIKVETAETTVSFETEMKQNSFQTKLPKRKQEQTRLLRKLKKTIENFTMVTGKQAVALVTAPGNSNTNYKVFGAQPLRHIIDNLKECIVDQLESALIHQPPQTPKDPTLFMLPPFIIDGIPTPLEKMTQPQLRTFIPNMLRYSNGGRRPGWGQESKRPPWWPEELPWQNIRTDVRSKDQKEKMPWGNALRKIIRNCYLFHGREDLLLEFEGKVDTASAASTSKENVRRFQIIPKKK